MFSISEDLLILYKAILFLAGTFNVAYALVLFLRTFKKKYAPYPSYRRSMVGASIAMLTFGLPYFIHATFSVRLLAPVVATVIGLTSFHIGAVLFAFSYLELLSPGWLTMKRKVHNIGVTVVSIVIYWGAAFQAFMKVFGDDTSGEELMAGWPNIPLLIYMPFFLHASYLAYRTYNIYIRKRRADPEAVEKTIRPFLEALPKSVHLIILSGIGSIVLYCIFPDGILVYTLLMFLAYFAFYYIFRALSRYGKMLLEENSMANQTRKWRRRLISYNFVYHSIVLVIFLGIFYIFNAPQQQPAIEDEKYPYLNLTKHSLWDNPNFEDHQVVEFFSMLYTNLDKRYFGYLLELNDESTTHERTMELQEEINRMSDNRYKGFMQTVAGEMMLSTMPPEQLTPAKIHDCLTYIYDIAQGQAPVPQQLFFTCWENAMACYADIDAIDSVKNEADRLLTICLKQNLPYGTIVAYSSLGNCLRKSHDYEGASRNLEIAIDAYDKLYTEKYGKNWREKDKNADNLLFSYHYMVSKNANYHLEYNDTLWLRQHLHELEEIEEIASRNNIVPIARNIYYTLAIYHDKWGDKAKYEEYVKRFQRLIARNHTPQAYGKQLEKELYYTILVRHALRNNRPQDAINYIDSLPDYFHDHKMSYYPDALLQLGRYEEAAAWYKQTIDYYYQQLNGRNRSIIASMTSGVGEDNHQMQIMQAQLRNQQTRLMYNSLLIFVLAIMIGGLAYFIYGQHRLNKKLSASIQAEERAKHVRDIFLKNMTHEFHTPLNALYGFSQILADPHMPVDENSTREMAGVMKKSAEHITKILDNIVEVTDKLSKMEGLEEVESIIKVRQENSEEAPYSL